MRVDLSDCGFFLSMGFWVFWAMGIWVLGPLAMGFWAMVIFSYGFMGFRSLGFLTKSSCLFSLYVSLSWRAIFGPRVISVLLNGICLSWEVLWNWSLYCSRTLELIPCLGQVFIRKGSKLRAFCFTKAINDHLRVDILEYLRNIVWSRAI